MKTKARSMQSIQDQVQRLKRPKLMVKAARISADTFNRKVRLPHLLERGTCPAVGEAIMQLLNLEGEANALRHLDDPNYSYEHHISLLAAIIAETNLLQLSRI
jgi:hypothetical protein